MSVCGLPTEWGALMRLLTHIARKIARSPENLATEALVFILQESAAARRGLARLMEGQLALTGVEGLSFSSQGHEADAGIPDLVGTDAGGHERLLIEAKFWAGLTEKQPMTYLDRLADLGGLVFVVPAVRAEIVWRELMTRLKAAGIDAQAVGTGGSYAVEVGHSGKQLRLTSWRTVLFALEQALQEAGEHERLEDVKQLQSLCDSMDQSAFLPINAEELSHGLWRRVCDFSGAVYDIGQKLAAGEGSKSLGRLSHGAGWTRVGVLRNGWAAYVYFDAWAMTNWRASPFWLELPASTRPHLLRFGEEPRRLWETNRGTLYIALPCPLGVERDQLVRAVSDACEEIIDGLPIQATEGSRDAMPTDGVEDEGHGAEEKTTTG